MMAYMCVGFFFVFIRKSRVAREENQPNTPMIRLLMVHSLMEVLFIDIANVPTPHTYTRGQLYLPMLHTLRYPHTHINLMK